MKTEVKEQIATQDYDCDWCENVIPDEASYIRVAILSPTEARPRRTVLIEKFHPECWEERADDRQRTRATLPQ